MMSGREGELRRSMIDSCGVFGRRVMTNSVLCTNYDNWTHGRCAKMMKIVTQALARHFVYAQCLKIRKGEIEPIEELWDNVEAVGSFCYLGNRLSASGGYEVPVTARTKCGWEKFRDCSELLLKKILSEDERKDLYLCKIRYVIF